MNTPLRESVTKVILRILVLIGLGGLSVGAEGQDRGGGAFEKNPDSCVTQEDWARMEKGMARYEKEYGPLSKSTARGAPSPFTFYPMAGTLFGDVFINNFVDLMPGPGILTWDCTSWSNEGHDAQDVDLRGFGEQAIGVPIFAVNDGVVVDAHDGEDDMNTETLGQPANYVLIDHGAGRLCYYIHMKKNSVEVSMGEIVRAGEQIGKVGSSGNSTGPHLHFSTFDNGSAIEPFAGPCNPVTSVWVNQESLPQEMYIWEFGLTPEPLGGDVVLPQELPRTGQIALSDADIQFWYVFAARQENSVERIQLIRPNGSTYFDLTEPFNNAFKRSGWLIKSFPNPGILGTWRYIYSVNGKELFNAPFDIVATVDPGFNRPPEPITVGLEPLAPTSSDVIVCRVKTSLVLDDLDYDIVDYEYVWKANGFIVRCVVSAAHSDALARNYAPNSAVLTCTVTPGDGTTTGPPATVSVVLGGNGEGSGGESVWTDFAYSSFEMGTFRHPVNSLAEATLHVASGGVVNIKGDTAVAASDEAMIVSKPMTIRAVGGTVRLGTAP